MNIRLNIELTGRELFLVKSILNIKDCYGHNRFIVPTDMEEPDVRISQHGSDYKACVLKDNKVFTFKPTINPKTISQVLTQISQYLDGYDTDSLHLIDHIVNLMQSKETGVLIVGHDQFFVEFSTKTGLLRTNFEADITALVDFIADETVQIKTNVSDEDLSKANYEYPLYKTLWDIALQFKHSVYDKHFHNDNFKLELENWPNFGHLRFQQPFIYLTAALKSRSLTLAQLLQLDIASEETVYGYLNAMILSGHIKVIKTETSRTQKVESNKPVSRLLQGLKGLFSKTG
ncbi:hypothetical protein [Marinicella gelatinilytica]|uniref:hypothetical protein n=1 Tax=Marinicella gelatinilytica TaxID=2996017 RepID=UPI002260BC40|nr:hypothetical protein [Marinicella gelatinilytica]MCX7545134.1 hypothetical protein [Marinicella gelatinilytica]